MNPCVCIGSIFPARPAYSQSLGALQSTTSSQHPATIIHPTPGSGTVVHSQPIPE